MSWRVWIAIAAVGCGGKTVEAPGSGEDGGLMHGSGAIMGSCSLASGVWSCATASSPSAGDGGPPRILPPCNAGVGTGTCVAKTGNIVGTLGVPNTSNTNSNQLVPITNSECLACTNGMGIDWVCISQSWQAVGTFSCSQ